MEIRLKTREAIRFEGSDTLVPCGVAQWCEQRVPVSTHTFPSTVTLPLAELVIHGYSTWEIRAFVQ